MSPKDWHFSTEFFLDHVSSDEEIHEEEANHGEPREMIVLDRTAVVSKIMLFMLKHNQLISLLFSNMITLLNIN